MLQKLLWIAVAGGMGALARYGLSGLVQRTTNGEFPWGTFVVNVTGCLVFGMLSAIAESRLSISGETRTIILVGFMGSFTTFSTFAFETSEMLRVSQWLAAAGNVAGHNIAGIIALLLGLYVGGKLV
ncbi:MAG: fluoride efflux transporter CrcB [Candidatus Nealsonbacteria bacterium]|nr:fluoride efflux transporter CrcB [Candidatus Nealsonbacteria bacterium]